LTAQDTVGIDVALVEETQRRLLALFPVPPGAPRGGIAVATLCAGAVAGALYKATNGLLDDLHRNVRLLGTPERCGAGHVPRNWKLGRKSLFIYDKQPLQMTAGCQSWHTVLSRQTVPLGHMKSAYMLTAP